MYQKQTSSLAYINLDSQRLQRQNPIYAPISIRPKAPALTMMSMMYLHYHRDVKFVNYKTVSIIK